MEQLVKKFTEKQKGNAYIIVSGIFWSLFPVITVIGIKGVPIIVSLFWAIFFSIFLFLFMIAHKGKWAELRNKEAWKYAFGTAIFVGVIYYGLYFYGLSKTAPANAAIIALFEVATSYAYFQLFHKEHISKKHIWGIILATLGAVLILLRGFGHFNLGDLFILLGTFFVPFGNRYAQKTRKLVSGETQMFMRSVLTLPFLFLIATAMGTSPVSHPLGGALWWILFNGLLVLGLSRIFWTEAIHRMTVTKASAISSLSPFFTIIFAWLLLGQAPTPFQIFSLPILIVGIFLLTDVKIRLTFSRAETLS